MWLIALIVASGVMGLTIVAPALPLIQQGLGSTSDAVQKLLTVYLFALAAGQLVYGTVSDRIGRRPVLLFGALLYAVGGAAAMFANNIELLTFCRIIQGLGAAACVSMGRAIVGDSFDRSDGARNMSTVATILAILPICSLAFGGLLAELVGWQSTMALISISGFLAFFVTWLKIQESNLEPIDSINLVAVFQAYRTVLKNPIFFCFMMTCGMQVGMFFAMNGFLPFQYQRLGYSSAEFGLWFATTPVSYLLGNALNRSYFVARGIERAAMLGCLLSLLSVIAYFVTQAMGMTHALSLAIPGSLFGFSNGIVVANTTMGAITAAGRYAGTGNGISGAWQMAAGGIAGVLITALGGAENFQIAAGGMIVMSLIAVMAMYYVYADSLKKTELTSKPSH
ncbi:MAG: multidrug effflux MFS transporter [Granulosicoccus sp.]|nr:multidrug effflux MFS transporter [Granulosicoccus sp.]